MVASLLVALGFSVSITPASRDNGIDLVASYNSTDPFGAERKESWLVVAKLYNKQRVSVTTLRQMIGNLVMARGQHKGLMVTTGQLTSVASEFLNELSFSSRADLRVIDGSELTQLLLQHPEVVRGYFPVDAGK